MSPRCQIITWTNYEPFTDEYMHHWASLLLWCVNSLWLSDAKCQHRSGSTLAQVLAYCLMVPSHYLNQCWFFGNKEFKWEQFHSKCPSYYSVWITLLKLLPHLSKEYVFRNIPHHGCPPSQNNKLFDICIIKLHHHQTASSSNCIIVKLHHRQTASSSNGIIIELHCHQTASSSNCIIDKLHHHQMASSSNCIIIKLHHRQTASSSNGIIIELHCHQTASS